MNNKHTHVLLIISLTLGALIISLLFLKTSYGNEKKLSVYEKIKKKENLSYLVIGDSIGRGSGADTPDKRWFKQLEEQMRQKKEVKMKGQFLVQSGATAFEGLYKLQSQKINESIDLAFIVFGENDRKYMDDKDFGMFYEALIRQTKAKFPSAEIITITESCLKYNSFADQILILSSHYKASNVDMRSVFKRTGLGDKQLTRDGIHPNAKGYSLYSSALYNKIIDNTNRDKSIASLETALNPNTDIKLGEDAVVTHQYGFKPERGYFKSQKKGSYIEYDFPGSMAGFTLLRSPDGGLVNVYIDGRFVSAINTWWPFIRERHQYIKNGLSEGIHTIRFEAAGEKSASNVTKHSVIRVSSVIINKNKK